MGGKWAVGVCCVLLVVGASAYVWKDMRKPLPKRGQEGQQSTTLAAEQLKRQDAVAYLDLPGRTAAYQIAEVRPQVGGIIADRLFKEGGEVLEGDQLYQIDPAPFEVAYSRALANLRGAEAEIPAIRARSRRYGELVQLDAVSVQEYDDTASSLQRAEAAVAVAKAAVQSAEIDLAYSAVYAPLSGRISKSNVTKGALVTADQTQVLATITQLDPIYVDISQSSVALMRLQRELPGFAEAPLQLFLGESTEAYPHSGALQFHEVFVDSTTGSVQSRALFPNPEGVLLPGLFVRVRLPLVYPNVLLVAQSASQRQPDGSLKAWVIDSKGEAQQVPFKASRAVGDSWLVESGLEPGTVVITGGTMGLRAGTPVQPLFAEVGER